MILALLMLGFRACAETFLQGHEDMFSTNGICSVQPLHPAMKAAILHVVQRCRNMLAFKKNWPQLRWFYNATSISLFWY